MRLVLSCEAIERLNGSHDDSQLSRQSFAASRAVTKEILECYKRTLGNVYGPWFANEMHCNGFRLLAKTELIPLPNSDTLGEKNCYVTAAYVWGKTIIGDSLKISEIEEIASYGIEAFDLSTAPNLPPAHGPNPIFEWILHRGDSFDGDNLRKLFKFHDEITILDRFIYTKPPGQRLIKELLRNTSGTFKLSIFGTDGSEPAAKTMKTAFDRAFPRSTISTIICDLDSRLHDRHIVLNNRIQISITAGLDMFTNTDDKMWTASSDGKISVYSLIDFSTKVQLRGKNHTGAQQSKMISLAHKP